MVGDRGPPIRIRLSAQGPLVHEHLPFQPLVPRCFFRTGLPEPTPTRSELLTNTYSGTRTNTQSPTPLKTLAITPHTQVLSPVPPKPVALSGKTCDRSICLGHKTRRQTEEADGNYQ